MTPADTSLTGSIRTVSGTSVNGSEVSFADQGFENISLSGITHLTSPRIIASKVNEQDKLSSLPGVSHLHKNLYLLQMIVMFLLWWT